MLKRKRGSAARSPARSSTSQKNAKIVVDEPRRCCPLGCSNIPDKDLLNIRDWTPSKNGIVYGNGVCFSACAWVAFTTVMDHAGISIVHRSNELFNEEKPETTRRISHFVIMVPSKTKSSKRTKLIVCRAWFSKHISLTDDQMKEIDKEVQQECDRICDWLNIRAKHVRVAESTKDLLKSYVNERNDDFACHYLVVRGACAAMAMNLEKKYGKKESPVVSATRESNSADACADDSSHEQRKSTHTCQSVKTNAEISRYEDVCVIQ